MKEKWVSKLKHTLWLTFNIKIMVSFSMFWHWKYGKFSEKQEKKRKKSTRKNIFFPPKKPLCFVQTSNPNTEQDVNHNCPRHPNLHAPWTILITSLTSAKPRRAVLGKNWTSGLGYICIVISQTCSISLTVGPMSRKIRWKERFLHFDQKHGEVIKYIEGIRKIPQTGGVLVLSFALTGDEIKKKSGWRKIVHKNKTGDQTSFLT
jgi:hypothetical protein